MKLRDIASWLQVPVEGDSLISSVCIDSRVAAPGCLFVAIKGEHFDGHAFIPEAISRGAAAVVCSQPSPGVGVPQLVVDNTIKALGVIATKYREQCSSCKVVAVTGSNGKTTVKGMIASILPQPSFSTPGNFNNHIGVPLSLFQLKPEHEYAVFELGANHLREIETTVQMVQPHVTLVNNIGPAHIGEFGSVEAIAKAKGEIYQGLRPGGTAVINDDDAYAHFWDAYLTDKTVVHFSLNGTATIHASKLQYQHHGCAKFTIVAPTGTIDIQLSVPGTHNVYNALAATACTYALGIDLDTIAAGLSSFRGVPGRLMFRPGKRSSMIIDDTYNANLGSVETSLQVLANCDGHRIFVFGDMSELGAHDIAHHKHVAHVARQLGIDRLMTYGSLSQHTTEAFGRQAKHYLDRDLLISDLLSHLNKDTTVLVKGSRASKMEAIVGALVGAADNATVSSFNLR